jgi:sortase A
MPRPRRKLGTILIVVGTLALAYGATVYFWKDPVTDLYAAWKQHQLNGQLQEEFAAYEQANEPAVTVAPVETTTTPASPTADTPPPTPAEPVAEPEVEDPAETVRRAAERYFAKIKPGQALGRLTIPKLDIDPVFVNGTKWGRDLSRGPGRYPETSVPGLGELTAIAGHRTTFGAWFRHIDELERGDDIVVELPYGTFHYVVTGHEIVDDEDWSVIEPRGYDTLVLSACHPLYSAKQRWIVYARLDRVELPDGESFKVGDTPQVAAAAAG